MVFLDQVACLIGVCASILILGYHEEHLAYTNELAGQWDEFFSRIGNAPSNGQAALGANVLSASQPGAQPVEITTNERARESPEKGAFPMQAQTGS
jgi:hypothetical protein